MKADEDLTRLLKEDEELMMQILYLVVSYEDGKQWRLLCPIAFAGNWIGRKRQRVHGVDERNGVLELTISLSKLSLSLYLE